MATNDLVSVEATLVEQRASALRTFTQKLTEAEEAADVYDRMDAAIAALTGSPKEGAVSFPPFGKKVDANGSQKKKHATKEHVLPVLQAIVRDNPGIDKADAEELSKQSLKERGLGINGVSSQIRKYLASDLFQVDDSGRVSVTSK
ncbi:MAG: hypothetical protein KDA86_15935 [Planctomycetaceae bacterium]|nr:hypothetical protein [Planctomycetaceae bacterium]